jgi:hypothetical protein
MKNNIDKYNELAYYTLGLQDECFVHQYVVEAHSAQFANAETKTISLTFALVGLYLSIEKSFTGKEVQKFHTIMSNQKTKWPDFTLPKNRGEVTIDEVLDTPEGHERNSMIRRWSHSVWMAYSECHADIKDIAAFYLRQIQ